MKKKYEVIGMSCAACASTIDKAVRKLKGVNDVNVNLLTNCMEVDFDENKVSDKDIEKAVVKVGYKLALEKTSTISSKVKLSQPIKNDIIKLVVSGVFMLVLLYVSMGMMWNWPEPSFLKGEENLGYLVLIEFVLTLPTVIIYFEYFISGYTKLFRLHPNMDSLVALGASASLIYGIVALFLINTGNPTYIETYQNQIYFDSASMILTLVSLGKLLEKISKNQTTNRIEKLVNLSPNEAVILKNNKEIKILVNEVNIGDIVIVKRGELIPIDGEIIEGNGSINEANITGESTPVYKKENDIVYSSTTLTNGYLKIRATKVGEDTSFGQIVKLVEEASNSKAPISRLVDKIALYFVPIVIGIALISLIVFLSVGEGVVVAFNHAITTLVIACPCAMGLATPVAIMVGVGKGASSGLLIKNAEILQKAGKVNVIVLDKTGTITEGKPKVTDYIKLENEESLNDVIYSLERLSNHPLANAITEYFNDANKIEITNYEYLEGRGIIGYYQSNKYEIVNYLDKIEQLDSTTKEIYERLSSEGKTVLFVLVNEKIYSLIAIKDEIKEGSKEAIKALHKLGLKVIMLTGDNQIVSSTIASEVGIDEYYANVMPSEKGNIINKLKEDKSNVVAMVGDGVNDAVALTYSDLSIAMGEGSEVAIENSDIILESNNLMDIRNAIGLSKRTMNTIIVCLVWAFLYNSVCILLACGCFYPLGVSLTPMIGSICMCVSSVLVVLTALTINLYKIRGKEIEIMDNDKLILNINGMKCVHCTERVKSALETVKGVTSVEVSLENGNAVITTASKLKEKNLYKAVSKAGYELTSISKE